MTPALIILLAWLLFALSHLYMSGSDLRTRLSHQITRNQFTALFALVTIVTMCVLILAVARYGNQGWPGPALGQYPIAQTVLAGVSFLGVLLSTAGLMNYPKSPMAILAARSRHHSAAGALRPPTIVERVSRHPFFAGIAIFMASHVLLATTLASAVHFGGYVLFAVIGIRMQDRKLRDRWQEVYADFENKTSAVPLARLAKEQHQITPAEWRIWVAALLVTALLVAALHWFWASWNGAAFLAFDMIFGTLGVAAALVGSKARKA